MPVIIAASIVIYAVITLGTISKRIDFIEAADDINLTLLELRRYEKNIMLFKEEENTRKFYEYLAQLDSQVRGAERQIVKDINRQSYRPLLEDIKKYKESVREIISVIKTEQDLLKEIRPLGRLIEKKAQKKESALELRRYEKNYIIYGEHFAAEKVHRIEMELGNNQPELRAPLARYSKVFDALTRSEGLKAGLTEKMRHSGRAIEKVTMQFALSKREAINRTISGSRNLLLASLIILVCSTIFVACLFSMNVVRTLKTMEKSFARLKAGDFDYGIDLRSSSAPAEIVSFVKAYNQTIDNLRLSKIELENTLKKIEVTNRELIERQDDLVEAKKLSAMRLLAAEIAHEINNPLSSLKVFLSMFYEDMREDDTKKEALTLMLKEVNRCQDVLRELGDFARKEPLKLRKVCPPALVNEAIDIVSEQNRQSGINVNSSLEQLPETAVLDPILIYQALVNVFTNAWQVTPPGGNVLISGFTEADIMTIVVKDEGPGISEENLPHIFDPFFSTRKESGGNGLGLAITRKIVERHSGSVQVESRAGEGTVFKINLPVNLSA